MSNKVLQPLLATTFDHLLKTAARNPEGAALCYKHRGVRIIWSWRNVVAAANRYASGLRRHGVEPGSVVALAGEISPNLVIATLAARINGASLLSIAPNAKASAIHEAQADGADRPAGLAVVQGRTAPPKWVKAANRTGKPIPIVFDHMTPPGRSSHSSVRLVADVRDEAAANGRAERLQSASITAKPTLWVEATTGWTGRLDAVINSWIASSEALALPELLAAPVRDRREIRPNRWIASAERVTANYAEIASRLPLDCGVGGRIVARAPRSRESSGSLLASFFTTLRRYRLSLCRLSTTEVGGVRKLLSHNDPAERLFTALGVLPRRIAPELAGVEARNFSSGGPLPRLVLTGVA